VAQRAMHLHGALGVSDEMPFMGLLLTAEVMGIADGPTEVHKVTIARQVLRDYKPADGLWPTEHLPSKRAAARERLAHLLEAEVGNL
jgi:acyl-CoA dehydrogenase